jgi:xanthine dehydrogenase YagS FAD-binding subunit
MSLTVRAAKSFRSHEASQNQAKPKGEKESFDWALADVAVVLEGAPDRVQRAAIVLGAAAPIPWRATAAEAALVGQPINEDTARAAARAAVQGATPLSQNAHKVPIFEVIVYRTILMAVTGQQQGQAA